MKTPKVTIQINVDCELTPEEEAEIADAICVAACADLKAGAPPERWVLVGPTDYTRH